ncbi:MAG: pyridoxal-phosphate dependent enzyme [Gammaproteobacteria bacterium]|nr:pyridoxal-phosphate dependent enzyme [Gammaproteobacteria bacterium]NNC96912.1 pyridoxal-phosphate dependent enzyme [Gammaproteobacteria bacterium]NNM13327.1 pyridoxal-phosphate dependent enzyme [Gammaproteobacteria bacterium]
MPDTSNSLPSDTEQAAVYPDVISMIGKTPMVRINSLDTGLCELYIKLESMNPGGSVKDRIGLQMITAAEQRGELKPGDTVIEATAGNTGIGLALVAGQKGYNMVLVMPDKMSREKVDMLKAMGAEVLMTRSDVAKGHPEYYQDLGKRLAEENGWFFINQFANPDNPKAHELTTAPEIFSQLDNEVDAIVVGVGSSGTISGISAYLKRHAPDTEIVLADPEGSILAPYIKTGKFIEAGSWLVEGIGEDFIPDICDLSLVKNAYAVTDAQAFKAARDLLQVEGIFGGPSSGTLLYAALEYCRAQTEPKKVVTFACDTGNRYLSKAFNGGWLYDMGFEDRPFNRSPKTGKENTTRAIIGRLYERRQTIVVSPTDSLLTALKRFRDNSVSQLPVIDDGEFAGILTDSMVMQYASLNPGRMHDPVSNIDITDFPILTSSNTLEEVQAVLEDESYVVVFEDARFLGLITRIDILNYLYRMDLFEKNCE